MWARAHRGRGSLGPCHLRHGDPGHRNWPRVSSVCSCPHLASNASVVCRIRRPGSHHAELGRKAGCSMHRDALGGRASNRSRDVVVVGRNRRDSCQRRMGYSLLSTVLCVSLLNSWIHD